MSRTGVLGTIVAATCLAGCSAHASVHLGSTTTVKDPAGLVSGAVSNAIGHSPRSVDCPDDVPAKNGHRFRCMITDDDGSRFAARATESGVHSRHVHIDVQVRTATPADEIENPEKAVSDALTNSTHRPKSVDCPSHVPTKVGHRFRCVVTVDDGGRIGATVTEVAVHGSDIRFYVQVDRRPLQDSATSVRQLPT